MIGASEQFGSSVTPTRPPIAMPACASCGAADAGSTCGGCKSVAYCGPACQRADWAAHRPACKAIAAAIAEDAAGCTASGRVDPKRTLCDGCGAPLGDADNRCTGCRFPSYCGQPRQRLSASPSGAPQDAQVGMAAGGVGRFGVSRFDVPAASVPAASVPAAACA